MSLRMQLVGPWTLSPSCGRKPWEHSHKRPPPPCFPPPHKPLNSQSPCLSLLSLVGVVTIIEWLDTSVVSGQAFIYSLLSSSCFLCPLLPCEASWISLSYSWTTHVQEPRSKAFNWTAKACPPLSSLPFISSSPPSFPTRSGSRLFWLWICQSSASGLFPPCVFSSLYFLSKSSLYQQDHSGKPALRILSLPY